MENVKLGYAKIYFGACDFGKMLKLKDIENIAITDIKKDMDNTVTFTIATPMDNVTNERVKLLSDNENGTTRTRFPYLNDNDLKKQNNTEINFKEIANKKREEKQEEINEFNNVLLNNLESLRELFFQVELDTTHNYHELKIHPTNEDRFNKHIFNYENTLNIMIRGGLLEKTEYALKKFITKILLEYKTDIEGFEVPSYEDKWVFDIEEFKQGDIKINCETQAEFNMLYSILENHNILTYYDKKDFIRFGNRTCVHIFKARDENDKAEFRSSINGITYGREKLYKFKKVDFHK